jgi:hypothetical protein
MGVEAKSPLNIPSAATTRLGAYARVLFVQWAGTSGGYSAHLGRVHLRSKTKLAAQNRRSDDCGMPFAVILSRNALHPWVGMANQEAA